MALAPFLSFSSTPRSCTALACNHVRLIALELLGGAAKMSRIGVFNVDPALSDDDVEPRKLATLGQSR